MICVLKEPQRILESNAYDEWVGAELWRHNEARRHWTSKKKGERDCSSKTTTCIPGIWYQVSGTRYEITCVYSRGSIYMICLFVCTCYAGRQYSRGSILYNVFICLHVLCRQACLRGGRRGARKSLIEVGRISWAFSYICVQVEYNIACIRKYVSTRYQCSTHTWKYKCRRHTCNTWTWTCRQARLKAGMWLTCRNGRAWYYWSSTQKMFDFVCFLLL